MFKVNNKDTRTTPIASCPRVSIVNFEQVNTGWVGKAFTDLITDNNLIDFTDFFQTDTFFSFSLTNACLLCW